jgi:hypothetical protein
MGETILFLVWGRTFRRVLNRGVVAGDAWRPVVSINGQGVMLGIDSDGSWQVADGEQVRGPAVGGNLMMLLPLLERPYQQIADLVAADCPGRLWDGLLGFALDWPTEYWPGLAMTWVEEGYPVAPVRDALAVVKGDPRRSQPLRHRALRLCRRLDG